MLKSPGGPRGASDVGAGYGKAQEGEMPDYDVIVIGGGSAGTSAATAATRAGARTLMVNAGELGGLCILRGCMPTKALLASAHPLHDLRQAEALGLRHSGRLRPDFRRIMQRKERLVARFQRAKIASIERHDYEVLGGHAAFAADGSLAVDGRPLRARAYVIATGSVPVRLQLPGVERVPVLDSDDVMRLEQAPEALLVQGAGAIGLELAQLFAWLGTRVLLVNRSPLLSHFDADCGAELTRALEDEPCLELAVPGRIESLRPASGGKGLVAEVDGAGRRRSFEADALLLATGRRPALDGLGLEHVGVRHDGREVERDATLRTTNPAIWVAGDATGCHQVLHLANQEGAIAGANAAGTDPPLETDYRLRMSAIFTEPAFAHVGATEAELRSAGRPVVAGTARFPETGRAITMETRHGLWKLLADPADGRILGSSILGPRADDLVHVISSMMYYGGSVDDVCCLPWYHPTLSEVLLTVARDVEQRRHHESPPGEATLPPGYFAGFGGDDA
jgi:pyruvate/2-oxoglutarate dehydrogenase complex dihydrolipoamide dehydrogenase (E3) component